MNKPLKSALFFTAVIVVISFLQFFISSSLYLNVNIIDLLAQWVKNNCRPLIFISLGGGLLSGFLWNENSEHPIWKRLVLRVLITTLLLMIANTIYAVLFGYLGNMTLLIHFLNGLEHSFMLACVFTIVFIVVPDDVEKEPKRVNNPGVIDGEIK